MLQNVCTVEVSSDCLKCVCVCVCVGRSVCVCVHIFMIVHCWDVLVEGQTALLIMVTI